MRWLILLPALYLAAVIETTCGGLLSVRDIAPDLISLVAAAWILSGRRNLDFVVAGGIGLIGDLLPVGRPGVGAATLLVCGYALTWVRWLVPRNNLVCQVPLTGLFAAAVALTMQSAAWLSGDATLAIGRWLVRAGEVGVYTALISLPIFMAIAWLNEPRRQTVVG